jgi:hypothetical protein
MGFFRTGNPRSVAVGIVVASLMAFVVARPVPASNDSRTGGFDPDFYKVSRVKLEPMRSTPGVRKRAAEIQEFTEVQSRSERAGAWQARNHDLLDTLLDRQAKAGGGDALVVIDKIIAIGEKIWPIVKANEPKATLALDHVDIVPEGISAWQQLEKWQTPRSRYYKVSYENIVGVTLASFTFQIIYTPAGTYEGKGKYLSHVSALAADLYVFFGVTFNANASIVNVANAGTAKDPIAAAQVQVDWSMDTIVAHDQGTQSVYVRGDGFARDL